MHELKQIFADPDTLLDLEPEELGAKILFLLQKRSFHRSMFNPRTLNAELWPISLNPGQPPYAQGRKDQVEVALVEAWAWLEAQGLIVPATDSNADNGWKILSRRAKRFQNEREFAQYAFVRMLPKEQLHPRIATSVWMAFVRSEFDIAVFQAMKAVEVAVREASGLGDDVFGVALMRKAFNPDKGPLTDFDAESGERSARMDLFAGAVGSYKNPQSHRDVNLDDPLEALEIILLASHLLRIIDSRIRSQPASAIHP